MTTDKIDPRSLFKAFYTAGNESEIDDVMARYSPFLETADNWRRLGGIDNNFGVIENQQASPIAALIEKLTNSIDAILMRRCLEQGVDPQSELAPRSMHEAIERFFPHHKLWDYPKAEVRRQQAEHIQVLADGPRGDTSLIIFDDGEGQHPEAFEDTFLSLLRGNKNDIHFVQGKYNMGGSGAIVFCGRNRYQLIGSRRFDGTGRFGFTLIRKHPLSNEERTKYKNTWYEFLVVNGAIPAFACSELDLGLHQRRFTTGTIIKLYSYDLPSGISDISRDLNQSINEYLFEPALPMYIIESESRYPHNVQRERHLYGLKRRLEQEDSEYIEDYFSEEATLSGIGTLRATCYVFRSRAKGKNAKETRESISREFFKNNMSVLFSVNGQVHGHYTSEFITRTLKMNLLRNYLLIHVDCTQLEPDFRNELTMASRDRLKGGVESRRIRDELGKILRKSRLSEINKRRKDVLDLDSSQADELVRSFADNLPLDSEMTKLLDQVFQLHRSDPQAKKDGYHRTKRQKQQATENDRRFEPKRFPSFFRMQGAEAGETPAISIPYGSERKVLFSTDVENMYFDRIEEPGDLEVGLLDYQDNSSAGGGKAGGKGETVSSVLNIRRSSPDNGTIKLHLSPTEAVNVGDAVRVKVTLTSPNGDFEQGFWVKVRDPKKPPKDRPDTKDETNRDLGLPAYKLVASAPTEEGWLSWDNASELGAEMDHTVVMHPVAEGDTLRTILINMDSSVWLNYRSSLGSSPTPEQLQVGQRKYIASVYFHTLFLYIIMKTRGYQIQRERRDGDPEQVGIEDYLKDVFQSCYADFLMRFNMTSLIEALAD
ncbi:MAG TPA: hypothetical protein PKY77_07650 [Phycisphaerae bacterium]|nr:hypothetical protein [Phycisphaerae bacterium]HRY67875.1 hypothetical protein [Phycisphaerae bacterium]HSA25329.1 hypothetical protein [Phycisphaerae bacterium]